MQAQQTGRMANSSYTKLFFPCSENGADVNAVDVIRVATQSDSATLPGDGLKIAAPLVLATSALGSGTLPEIPATSDFIVFAVAGAFTATGGVTLGNSGLGDKVVVVTQSGGVTIKTATEEIIWSAAMVDTVNPVGYSIACKRGEDLEFIQGSSAPVAPVSVDTQLTEAFAPDDHMALAFSDVYGVAIFEFPNGMPSDYKEAVAWMGEKWAVGQKVIWPAWEDK